MKGTEKQIAWAEDIKARFIRSAETLETAAYVMENVDNLGDSKVQAAQKSLDATAILIAQMDAEIFYDHTKALGKSIAEKTPEAQAVTFRKAAKDIRKAAEKEDEARFWIDRNPKR